MTKSFTLIGALLAAAVLTGCGTTAHHQGAWTEKTQTRAFTVGAYADHANGTSSEVGINAGPTWKKTVTYHAVDGNGNPIPPAASASTPPKPEEWTKIAFPPGTAIPNSPHVVLQGETDVTTPSTTVEKWKVYAVKPGTQVPTTGKVQPGSVTMQPNP